MNDVPAGVYGSKLINVVGEVTYNIIAPESLISGVCQLQLTAPDNCINVMKVDVQKE